ncbi:MAG TPA: DUF2231 domain-containing protein [Cellulomonas sp.]|nr:DUF2231 domain-containing protein [Cellulomonas sp.]
MFDTIAGLPLHPLVVHATEVIVPAAALVLLLAVLWPRFRRWARYLPLGLSIIAVVLVPLSTESGEALEHRVGGNDLIETHSQLAEGLLPWLVALAVVALALVLWHRKDSWSLSYRNLTWIPVALAVAGVLAATGTTVQAVRVGHSGATAVWSGDVASSSSSGTDSDKD